MTPIAQTYPQLALQLAGAGWTHEQLATTRDAHELASSLFAGAERGSGKPFVDHLVGTASGVLLGGGDADTVAAALLHAAYDQGDFGARRAGAREPNRRTVRAAVGAVVEDLVLRYHRLGWNPEVASAAVAGAADAPEPDRAVLLVRVANEIDDALDGGLALAGKQLLDEHQRSVHELVVDLAEQVGTPDLAELAREVLLGPPPSFPPELVVGAGTSRRRLPRSTSPRLTARALHLAVATRGVVRRRLRRAN